MVRLIGEQEVIKKLQVRDVLSLPRADRRREIQLAIMEVPGLDPDNQTLIDGIERALGRITPRIKSVTPLTDEDLGALLGKSRATIQAYVGGRIPEIFTAANLDALLALAESRIPEINNLIRDIKRARLHAK